MANYKIMLNFNGLAQVIPKIKWIYIISMMLNYKYKIKWIYTESITKNLEIKISTICTDNIKNRIKYTNTLCRITLLWLFYFFIFV